MAAIADIVVYDGAATPVVHTLIAIGGSQLSPSKAQASWREITTGVPVDASVRLTMTLEKLKSGIYRSERKLVVPVMEVTSGANAQGYTAAPKVAHEITDIHVQYVSGRSDHPMRRLVRQLGLNIDGNVSTSVAAVATGAGPGLFDYLLTPN